MIDCQSCSFSPKLLARSEPISGLRASESRLLFGQTAGKQVSWLVSRLDGWILRAKVQMFHFVHSQ